ncbi:MAG: acylphosphatase [Gammaproteobacteria bacterium]|nr:acylphosphatase [Gammaproteobacteria bacterium]
MGCQRCFISGRVQGVFFRVSTQMKAHDLDIKGYARNLADGRVEVLACGDDEKIKILEDWLWQGPVHAKVESVECEAVNEECPIGFMTN